MAFYALIQILRDNETLFSKAIPVDVIKFISQQVSFI